jgi:hypothetical protein
MLVDVRRIRVQTLLVFPQYSSLDARVTSFESAPAGTLAALPHVASMASAGLFWPPTAIKLQKIPNCFQCGVAVRGLTAGSRVDTLHGTGVNCHKELARSATEDSADDSVAAQGPCCWSFRRRPPPAAAVQRSCGEFRPHNTHTKQRAGVCAISRLVVYV